jgi:hypothetical protein
MSMPQTPSVPSQKVRERCWPQFLLVGFIILCCAMAYFVWRVWAYTSALSNGYQPPEMAAAQYSDKAVHADLGGMLVAIPRHFADYVEYNGDPGFGQKREGPRPVRDQYSKLMSFGFYVSYPDMRGLDSPEIREEKRTQLIRTSPWIKVGFNTGEIYPGDGFLDRWESYSVGKNKPESSYTNYEKLPQKEHDLEVYALKGLDPKTNKPYREGQSAQDIFIYRQADGHVGATFKCGNTNLVPQCWHEFSLEPQAHAVVYMSYRRSLLPEWQSIQTKVRDLVLTFAVKPQATEKAVPTNTPKS